VNKRKKRGRDLRHIEPHQRGRDVALDRGAEGKTPVWRKWGRGEDSPKGGEKGRVDKWRNWIIGDNELGTGSTFA